MSSPLQTQITDLPATGSVADTDYTIVRKGVSDFKVQLGLIRQIDISALPSIGTPRPTDLMLINRSGSSFSVKFSQVGFVAGTIMWFYQDTPPDGWEPYSVTGDCLLAVRDSSGQYNALGAKGNWQQPGHALTINEMPSHRHLVEKTKEFVGSSNEHGPVRGMTPGGGSFLTEPTGGQGSDSTGTNAKDGAVTLAHNHGSTWRPAANVGVLGRKLP